MKGWIGGRSAQAIVIKEPPNEAEPRVLFSNAMADPKWITLEDAARQQGYALVPLDRVKVCSASTIMPEMIPEHRKVEARAIILGDLAAGIGNAVARRMMDFCKFNQRTVPGIGVRYETALQIIVPRDDEIADLIEEAKHDRADQAVTGDGR